MTKKEDLELVMNEKVKPVINTAMHKFLGITIDEVSTDISDRLKKAPLFDLEVDASLSYKKAKNQFRRYYLIRLLQGHFGNISMAAKIAGLDRRSIHRMIRKLKINPLKYREDIPKQYDLKMTAVKTIIEDTLDNYKQIINPERLEEVYKNVNTISDDIIKEMPEININLKDAEDEFEKRYISKVLKYGSDNITQTAKKIGLRYETLQRKMKKLGIRG